MANYYEDKVLEPKENGTKIEQLYFEGLKEVDEIFEENGEDNILLKREFKKVWDTERKGYKPVPPIALPTEMPMYIDGIGAISIRYSQYTPQRHDKIVTYPGRPRLYGETLLLSKGEKDFAWFLLIATNFVRRGDKNDKSGIYDIFNPVKELKVKSKEVKRRFEVEKLLSDETSPYYNLDALTMFADKFGINTDKMDVDLAAYTVREQVFAGEDNNNPAVNVQKFVEYAAVVGKKFKIKPIVDLQELVIPEGGWTEMELQAIPRKTLMAIHKKLELSGSPIQTDKALQELIFDHFDVDNNEDN